MTVISGHGSLGRLPSVQITLFSTATAPRTLTGAASSPTCISNEQWGFPGVSNSPKVVISASIAFDHIMSFSGSFKDHILAEKAHVLSVSFLLDSFKKQRGGVGGNIAYSLALLGEPSSLVGTVGEDFGDYRHSLNAIGVDTAGVIEVDGVLTASAFMNADLHGNQIASFFPGAMSNAREISISPFAAGATWGIVSAGDPEAMMRHSREIAASGCKLIFDPSQQIVILTPEQLSEGIGLAHMVVGNDYEYGMIERKTGLTIDDIERQLEITIVTYGENGSEARAGGERISIPIAPATMIVDPTGGGDAYRSGLIKGLLMGLDLDVAGRIAAQAATYAIEYHGTQEHEYSAEAFVHRFDRSFPDYAGRLNEIDFASASVSS